MSSISAFPNVDTAVTPKRVIVAERQGRLCNQLIAFAHIVAFSEETGCRVYNPSFYKYAHHFKHTCGTIAGAYPTRGQTKPVARWARQSMYHLSKNVNRLLKIAPWFGGLIQRVDARNEMRSLKTKPFPNTNSVIVDGWSVRDYAGSVKHADTIREFFTPNAEHQRAVDKKMKQVRESSPVVVGVHMRWGDYRTWDDGKFFRSAETFAVAMNRMQELLDRDVRFLVCCVEPIPPEPFRNFDWVAGPGGVIEDLYCLAQCDYLIGTPRSTYSHWASFYGKTPQYLLPAEPELFDLDSFKPHCLSIDA